MSLAIIAERQVSGKTDAVTGFGSAPWPKTLQHSALSYNGGYQTHVWSAGARVLWAHLIT